jgi:hypothetical protein
MLWELSVAGQRYRAVAAREPLCRQSRVLPVDHGAGSQIGDPAIFAGDLG